MGPQGRPREFRGTQRSPWYVYRLQLLESCDRHEHSKSATEVGLPQQFMELSCHHVSPGAVAAKDPQGESF
jgi:hypothetical protein